MRRPRPGAAGTTAAGERAAPAGARLLHATLAESRAARWDALTESLGIYPPGLPVLTPTEWLVLDLELDPDVAHRKFRALAAQETQTAGLIAALGPDLYTAWVGGESFVEVARRVDIPRRAVRRRAAAAVPVG